MQRGCIVIKKLIAGIALLAAGLSLYLTVFVLASKYLPQVSSWPNDKGRLWQAYRETGALGTLHMGKGLAVAGVVLMLWGIFEHGLASDWKSNIKKIRENGWGKEDAAAVTASNQTND